MEASISRLRSETDDLRNRGIVSSSAIGILEKEVGWALMPFNKNEEARGLLNQAISDLRQGLTKNRDDKEARYHLGEALVWSGAMAAWADQLEVALDCDEEATALLGDFQPNKTDYHETAFFVQASTGARRSIWTE